MSDTGLNGPAFRLLAACTDWPLSHAGIEKVRRAVEALGPGLPGFAEIVDRHRLAALAAAGLKAAGFDLPSDFARQVARDRQQAIVIAAEGLRLIGAFEECGIKVMMLKGPLLSQRLYSDIALRRSKDIDLLVDWKDFRAARDLLSTRNFTLFGPEPPWGTQRMRLWRTATKDRTFHSATSGVEVELHHRLKTPSALIPALGLDQADQNIAVGDRRYRAFGDRDLFTYLVVHAATELWHRLKWLADVRTLLSQRTQAQQSELIDYATAMGVGRCARLAIILCHRVWGDAPDPAIADALEADKKLRKLLDLSLDALANPDASDASIGTSVTSAAFLLRDGFAYRCSAIEAVLLDSGLISRIALPKALFGLYLPLRLAEWVNRRVLRRSRP